MTMPTLLWSTSSRPNLAMHAATACRTSSLFDASPPTAIERPPSERMISAVSSAALRLRSKQTTAAPSRANCTAQALPFPQPGPALPAPMTSATLSFSRSIVSAFREMAYARQSLRLTVSLYVARLITIKAKVDALNSQSPFAYGPSSRYLSGQGQTARLLDSKSYIMHKRCAEGAPHEANPFTAVCTRPPKGLGGKGGRGGGGCDHSRSGRFR